MGLVGCGATGDVFTTVDDEASLVENMPQLSDKDMALFEASNWVFLFCIFDIKASLVRFFVVRDHSFM